MSTADTSVTRVPPAQPWLYPGEHLHSAVTPLLVKLSTHRLAFEWVMTCLSPFSQVGGAEAQSAVQLSAVMASGVAIRARAHGRRGTPARQSVAVSSPSLSSRCFRCVYLNALSLCTRAEQTQEVPREAQGKLNRPHPRTHSERARAHTRACVRTVTCPFASQSRFFLSGNRRLLLLLPESLYVREQIRECVFLTVLTPQRSPPR